jgi:hypothetical protein
MKAALHDSIARYKSHTMFVVCCIYTALILALLGLVTV